MNGILIIDKPKGLTSRDVVNKVSKVLGTKKIGHTGTLDPLATGVLVLTIGKCTKLGEMLTSAYKKYHAEFVLGYETDTLDITGIKVKESSVVKTKKEILDVINSFIGSYMQEVPKYSAVKVDGRRLYDYAREGIEVKLPKREVKIKKIENISIIDNIVSFDVLVSKGTYIRSLIRDIGVKLGSFATMTNLRRTRQGSFDISNAITLDSIEQGKYEIIPKEKVLSNLFTVNLDDNLELIKKVKNGVALDLNINEPYIAFKYLNEVLCLYEKKGEKFRMYVMF